MTDREALARDVIARVGILSVKLTQLKPLIERLWAEFASLKHGETIAGCATKTEFCARHLHRTMRSVQYLLNGREHCSHDPEPAPCFQDLEEQLALVEELGRDVIADLKRGGCTEAKYELAEKLMKEAYDQQTALLTRPTGDFQAELRFWKRIAEAGRRLELLFGEINLRYGYKAGALLNELEEHDRLAATSTK